MMLSSPLNLTPELVNRAAAVIEQACQAAGLPWYQPDENAFMAFSPSVFRDIVMLLPKETYEAAIDELDPHRSIMDPRITFDCEWIIEFYEAVARIAEAKN